MTRSFASHLESTLKAALLAIGRVSRLKRIAPPHPQVELTLVSSPRMRALNSQYLGKDYPTDVLSFPTPEALRRMGHLGELVLCEPVLRRQAKEQGHSPEQEATVLIVHGLLHLLGLDHERSATEARTMKALEAALLAQLEEPTRGLIARSGSGRTKPWPRARTKKSPSPRTKSARSSRK